VLADSEVLEVNWCVEETKGIQIAVKLLSAVF
jgi:hypothetical protein